MPSQFDLAAYLRRIDFFGEARPDHATLSAIHALHVASIPFENLDPLLGRTPGLDLSSLEGKLVRSRRGGYCFEQNAVLAAALEAIGFCVTRLSARVRWVSGMDAPMTPATHMLLKVDMADGPWLADVGFGVHLQDAPLRLLAGFEQATSASVYRLRPVEHWLALEVQQPAGWRCAYLFTPEPQHPADYLMANWYTSTSPLSRFPKMLMVERLTSQMRLILVNRRLTQHRRDGREIERRLASAAELSEVLETIFGITPPAPIDQIWARVPAE